MDEGDGSFSKLLAQSQGEDPEQQSPTAVNEQSSKSL